MQAKLIAEPWDCGGLYQVGSFPNWDVWGEWNGRFRDDVRRFVKGDQGMKAAFATRLAGSADLYNVNQRRVHLHATTPATGSCLEGLRSLMLFEGHCIIASLLGDLFGQTYVAQ